VAGGYLVGVLWLSLFIFLYRWAINRLERRRRQKMAYTAGR
jgi:membrane-associated phospholipid phosphatase